MTRARVGVHYTLPPEPPAEEDTHYVDAGAVRIGVEHRAVDAESLRELYEGTEHQATYDAAADPTLSLVGVSLHVCATADGREYIRFDCFDGDAHYHYIHPRVEGEDIDNHVVWFDEVAHGPMLPWALSRIRTRLPEMLTEAGAPHVASQLDGSTLTRAAKAVEALAAAAIDAQRQATEVVT
jgi:hypothetical protein